MSSMVELQREGRELVTRVHHDPEAVIGALVRKINDVEERLNDMTQMQRADKLAAALKTIAGGTKANVNGELMVYRDEGGDMYLDEYVAMVLAE